jgi:5'-nucleotidase/UDP-sugar diphosphatase
MRPNLVVPAVVLAAACVGAGSLRPINVAAPIQVVNDLSTHNVRTEESNLANVIVDAVREVEKSDAAIVAASSFTDVTIVKGTANPAEILKAIEYPDDSIVIVKLTGAQIRRALEHGLTLLPQKNSAFPQVSGINASVDPGADKDKRVTSLRVGGGPVKDTATYTVAMPSPLANGALGYFKVWEKSKAIDHDTNKTLGQAVTDYLGSVRSIGAKGEDRLAIKR